MDNTEIKVRINLTSREFEVEGNAEYIEQTFGSVIREYLAIIKSAPSNEEEKKGGVVSKTESSSKSNNVFKNDDIPESFGEYFNKFPKSINNVDKLLIASFFVQSKNENKSFTISEASSLLVNQGVKLSNPNVFNKANDSTKKIFKLSGNNYRVSEIGIDYIKSL